jgi:hypothetical protein
MCIERIHTSVNWRNYATQTQRAPSELWSFHSGCRHSLSAGEQNISASSFKNYGYQLQYKTTATKQNTAYVSIFFSYKNRVCNSRQPISGSNAYAILSAPRYSGAEAIVISASWLSMTGEGNGTLNLRGVATVLSLASFLNRQSSLPPTFVRLANPSQSIRCGPRI